MKHFVLYYDWFDSLKCDAYFETNICCVSGQSVSLDTSKAKGAAISQMTRLPPTLPPSCLRMVYIVSVSPSLSHRHKCCRVRLSGGWEGMIGTHKFKQCTAAERMWPHPGRAHKRVCKLFFLFFSSMLSGFRPEAGWRDLKSKRNDNI